MSRIGKLPIIVPEGVKVSISSDNEVVVEGKKEKLTQKVDADIKVELKDGRILVSRPTEQKRHKAMHGLYRSLINNMIIGVTKGYEIKQELIGVGYRATLEGQYLDLALGYSHNILLEIPQEVKCEVKVEKREKTQVPIITLRSANKQVLGHVAAKIRSLRPPEPYKGKGIKFVGEQLRRKAGKSAGK